MTEFVLELALLFAVVLLASSFSYVRWKWKRVTSGTPGNTPIDYLWQVLPPLFFIILFTLITGGLVGLLQALLVTVVFFFVWFMFLDKAIPQERADGFFSK